MTQFEQDLKQDMSINGGASSKGMYNLVVSKRDLGLWKIGMKPNRHWKVSDVKKYFGLKGSKEKIYDDICKMVEEHKVFKPKPMGKEEFIEKYFYPELTEEEQVMVENQEIGWTDDYLLECAEKCNVDLELYEALD